MATRTGNQNDGPDSRTQRFLVAAEVFLKHKNFEDCQKNAFRAQALDPIHPGPPQLLAIAAVVSASFSSTTTTDAASGKRPDYYSILGVPRFTGDLHLIKTRFEKLTALLNPRENHYALSEQAYRLVTEAWFVLSVPAHRALFDEELKMKQQCGNGSETQSFWTMCPYCYYVYEYPKVYKECCLRCQNEKCRRAFHGVTIPPPPLEVVAMGKFSCPGFIQMRVEGGGGGGGNGMNSWTPFAPVGLGAFAESRAINGHGRDQRIETENGSDQRMEANGGNVGMKKQKMVAKSTKKLMGKGVRIEVIDAFPLEGTAEGKSKTEGNKEDRSSGYNCSGEESELIKGKLEFF